MAITLEVHHYSKTWGYLSIRCTSIALQCK